MDQIHQNINNGKTSVVRVADPLARSGEVLIANHCSLISAGTEKMVMDLSKKSLIGKMRERPDQVRRVVEKMKLEGVLETLRQVRAKLDQPLGLGYCSAGVVIAVGAGVGQFKVGDRVASNGPHAGIVSVPGNLCASFDDTITFEQAAFAVLGSIAMQGVRLSHATIGETVLVIGLGLVGQLAVGLLAAAGCRVIGTDPDPAKCTLALKSGAFHAAPAISASQCGVYTRGAGVDSVLITASTSSNQPIDLACEAVRSKGRIVLVGVVGLEIPRRPMYFKEAEFVVSCSYGPGRYDANYEDRGIDYPIGYVRWTEQRNIQAVLDLIGQGRLPVDHLISHRFDIANAEGAYDIIAKGSEPYLGVILNYPSSDSGPGKHYIKHKSKVVSRDRIGLSVLGAGNFAQVTMFPKLAKCAEFELRSVCSANGLSSHHSAEKFGFLMSTTDESAAIEASDTDAVMILTRHDLHASQVVKALQSGKHVFVEKPLAINEDQLASVEKAIHENPNQVLLVGFNRRFSAAAKCVKNHFKNSPAPLTIQYRFNAGSIPADSWIQASEEGGGRIIGEACHAIDLVTYLTGSLPVEVYASCIGGPHAPMVVDDQVFITLRHENGSVSSIGYLAGGDRAFSKERIEVLGGGKMAVIDDYRTVELASQGVIKRLKTPSGKGHLEEINEFASHLRQGLWPIPWHELHRTTLATFAAVMSLREGIPMSLQSTISTGERLDEAQLAVESHRQLPVT